MPPPLSVMRIKFNGAVERFFNVVVQVIHFVPNGNILIAFIFFL